MSDRAFVKIRTHLQGGDVWARAECSQAHVPCSVNGSVDQVAAWLVAHLLEFHTPTSREAP